MLQKKICMLGSYGVGKTSLVARFVHSIFSEKYQSTIGVKVDRKELTVGGKPVNMLLWDLHGDDEFQRVRASYLRGMSGYFLVIDGMRRDSVKVAIDLHELAKTTVGDVPFITLINKSDLSAEWEVDEQQIKELADRGWVVHQTSAKSGKLVNESFEELARQILAAEESDESEE